ncbi:MAG: ribonuclease HI [Candidatus Pristimantibacillus lignocellulolyticus]|uniref:Ribonuclease H n=1 Tax=Candidatus Pristimantibacillus lignocellulolyticus TaxID=2994561 RepID=A0A9J6ZGA7_9BACL|nr:MAG: ribonuclease HI [Candidatus Pristimantibacillus lignocellulolyticus]
MKEVKIYTDGACSGNPGPGGYGAILFFGEHRKEISGGQRDSTNNRMEILAVIKALEVLNEKCQVTVYSDSAYVVNCFQKGWIFGWMRNGWMNSKKQPVENQDLWKQLWQLMQQHRVEYVKVKGHSDNEFNNRCDELARAAIRSL